MDAPLQKADTEMLNEVKGEVSDNGDFLVIVPRLLL